MKTGIHLSENCTMTGCLSGHTSYQLNSSSQLTYWNTSISDHDFVDPTATLPSQIVKKDDHQKTDWFAELRKAVIDNIENTDFSPGTLSRLLCLSPSQLYRKVKAAADQTPIGFIRNARLDRAKKLLAASKRNISEIAYEVGFSDANYFSRTFHKEIGISPTDFRRVASV